MTVVLVFVFFFFNDTATTEIYTLSLHDALPISRRTGKRSWSPRWISRASKKYAAGGRSCATAASTRTRGSAAGSSTRNRSAPSTDADRPRLPHARGVGAAPRDVARMASQPERLAGQVRADSLGVRRDRPQAHPRRDGAHLRELGSPRAPGAGRAGARRGRSRPR